ncbi:DNA-binding response regulator [Allofranklinella schreckenbergeri]|uniref:DNA-binding response regulator n=1 Tax=Allofranklinella schreckenbergeri TaxID=1076744 RepID=A0A3M6Q2Z7_9BURK|nr:response regulator [Allofranklinella schreckenbergeri]RMW97587.1 DNA-binding response regulator [Allofranklinella schreckenbergeri]RMX02776.1 DNA-binding response regulator [Allofranklinella schreckenbergeri]
MNPSEQPTIYLVDDDAAFRRSVVFLLDSVGWQVQQYDSAQAFLLAHAQQPADIGCLLLDIRMPVMSGLALQQHLITRGWAVPIVFMTGHGDIEMAVQAMKAGAHDFLEKPFKDQVLLDAVDSAVEHMRATRQTHKRKSGAQALLERLSPREREVARLIAQGHPNKAVARMLEISEKTVHVHRQHVLEKTETANAAELTRLILLADENGLD